MNRNKLTKIIEIEFKIQENATMSTAICVLGSVLTFGLDMPIKVLWFASA